MRSFYPRLIVFSFLVFMGIPVLASDYFLISDVGVSARTLGMGHVEGFNTSSGTLFENPAGLTRNKSQSLSLFDTTMAQDVKYTQLSFSKKTDLGYFGVGYMQATVFEIPETGIVNGETFPRVVSTFDYRNTMYKFTYSRSFSPVLDYGVSYVHYENRFYTINGSGSNLDAGLLYRKSRGELSVFARNILPGSNVHYNNGAIETLPFQLVSSFKYPLLSAYVYPQVKYTQNHALFSLGVSYIPSNLPFLEFFGGYKQHLTLTQKVKNNASIGLGLHLYGVQFQYAYERSDYLLQDYSNYFSVQLAF